MLRFNKNSLSSLFLFGLITSNSAWAQDPPPVYQYRVKIPQTLSTCEREATLLASRFELSTGIRPTSSACEGAVTLTADQHAYIQYALTLSYTAPEQVTPYSALYGEADAAASTTNDLEGAYSTYAQCLDALPAQLRVFQDETGLMPVSSTCLPATYGFTPSYVMHIDGFGSPKKRLYGLEIKFMGQPGASAVSDVEDLMKSQGATIVAHTMNQVLYYADDTFAVKHEYFATLYSKDQCESQLDEARSIFAKMGSRASFVACTPLGVDGVYYLEGFHEGGYFITGDNGATFEKYYSFEECMNNITASNSSDSYAGGICHTSNNVGNVFELELFSSI